MQQGLFFFEQGCRYFFYDDRKQKGSRSWKGLSPQLWVMARQPPTYGKEAASPAGRTSPPVGRSTIREIDLFQGGVKDVADGGGKFPAGVDFPLGQQGDEVEGGPRIRNPYIHRTGPLPSPCG